MNNDPITPRVLPTEPTDPGTGSTGTVPQDNSIRTDPTLNQGPSDTTSQAAETVTPSTVESTEGTYTQPDPLASTLQDENNMTTNPLVEAQTPVVTTPTVEIPVNDSTVAMSDVTAQTPTIETVQEATPNDQFATQLETPSMPTLEAQPTPTAEPSISTQQPPAQPESLVAKFLHIFKK